VIGYFEIFAGVGKSAADPRFKDICPYLALKLSVLGKTESSVLPISDYHAVTGAASQVLEHNRVA
jgi:hypothetical protein